jgi:hypothetical protein
MRNRRGENAKTSRNEVNDDNRASEWNKPQEDKEPPREPSYRSSATQIMYAHSIDESPEQKNTKPSTGRKQKRKQYNKK